MWNLAHQNLNKKGVWFTVSIMRHQIAAIFALALLFTLSVAEQSVAAEFSVAAVDARGCDKFHGEEVCLSLNMVGQIEAGDAQKLQQEVTRVEVIISKNFAKAKVVHIFLESPGGSLNEAMNLGRFIRSNQISTQVAKGDTCASACVLVLAAGVKRIPVGDVVVHSFYSPEVLGTHDIFKAEKVYDAMSESVSTYLKEMRVSAQLLDEIIRVPHFKSRKLELDELVKLGLLGVDPVYAQVRSQAAIQSPAKK